MKNKILIAVLFIFVFINLSSAQSYITTFYDQFSGSSIDQTLWRNTSLVELAGGVARIGTGGVGTNASMNSTYGFRPDFFFPVNISYTLDADLGGVTPLDYQVYIQNATGRVQIITTSVSVGASRKNIIWAITSNNILNTYVDNVLNTTFSNKDLSSLGTNWTISYDVRKTGSTSTGEILTVDNVNYTYKPFVANVTFPLNNSFITGLFSNFSANYSVNNIAKESNTLVNATLYLWNPSGTVALSSNKTITGLTNVTNFTVSGLTIGTTYTFNTFACLTSNICGFSDNNKTFIYGLSENNFTYNSTSYETSTEGFILNLTLLSGVTLSSADLYYAGTAYAGTVVSSGTNYIISRALEIPLGAAVNSLFWSLTTSSGNLNTSTQTQTVSFINLTLCGAAPQNVPYINFTYKNETTAMESVSASVPSSSWTYFLGMGSVNKTLSYSTGVESPSHAFCFSPAHKTVNIDLRYTYDNSYSEQRVYQPGLFQQTNTTLNKILFLLPSSEGIFVTFQVLSAAGQPISGALVTVEDSSGNVISQTLTGGSGTTTVFLDPDNLYTVTVSKDGYSTFTVTQQFTTSEFSIILGGSTTGSNDYTRGISSYVLPRTGILFNQTTYEFNLTLNSSYWQLQEFGFNLYNKSGFVLASNSSTSSSGGFLSVIQNTGNHTGLTLNYYWLINGTYSNSTVSWLIKPDRTGSIQGFFSRLSAYMNGGLLGSSGEDRDFNLGILVFFAVFVSIGVLTFKFGIIHEVIISGLFFAFIGLFDVGLHLLPATPIPTVLAALIFVIFVIREVVR